MTRLYEQGADVERIETYIRRWWLWVNCGVFLGCTGGVVWWVTWLTHPTRSGDRTQGSLTQYFFAVASRFIQSFSPFIIDFFAAPDNLANGVSFAVELHKVCAVMY